MGSWLLRLFDFRGPRGRVKLALVLLLPMLAVTVGLVSTVQLRGALSVDNRTYVEMATGVRAHGLPFTYNAYAGEFPEARPSFNVLAEGKLWGNYTPLYPYVASLALRIGELAAISKQTFVLIALSALGVFGLGWRLSGDPLRGVVAAYLAAFASPIWASSIETLSLPLLYLWLVLAALVGLFAVDTRGPRTFLLSALAGLLSGLGAATHLLAFPMGIFFVLGLAMVRSEAPARPGIARDVLPDRVGLGRAACAAVGLALPLVPMSMLNMIRFGTRNPISYGPCDWAICKAIGAEIDARGLLSFVAPTIPYVAIVALALYFARRHWLAVLGVLAAAALALVVSSPFRAPALAIARTLFGYVIDVSRMTFPEFIDTFPDGFGQSRGGVLVKSLLQSSPVLVCALLVPFGRSGRAGRALLVLAPVLGLLAGLAPLARFNGAFAFGWPYVFFRYVLPAVPLLAVLTTEVLFELHWKRIHVVFGLGLGAACLGYFLAGMSDEPMLRRVLILRVTLAFALSALVLVWLTRRMTVRWVGQAASFAAAGAIALSVAVSMGVDTRILATIAVGLDKRVEAFAKITPFRFALVGYGPVSDHVLTLRAERDINYIDLVEAPEGSWDNFRILIDRWKTDDRPIFGIFPNDIDPKFRWPYADWDVPAEQLDEENEFWKIGPAKRSVTP